VKKAIASSMSRTAMPTFSNLIGMRSTVAKGIPMTQVAVIAKLTAVEGKGEDLSAAIAELVTQVRDDEPGTLIYAAAQDTTDLNAFWFYEFYDSADAAAAHSSGDALAAAGKRMRGLLAGPPEVHRLTPLAGKGLPD
jgi:quinol monooxygenase YgiN